MTSTDVLWALVRTRPIAGIPGLLFYLGFLNITPTLSIDYAYKKAFCRARHYSDNM